jgi:hypothetical protein
VYLSLQGNIGLGKAIEYFTSHQIPVSLPLNDTQKYDLVADIDGSLKKIQIKTTRNKHSASGYEVMLRNCGGASGKCTIRHFNSHESDFLFVYTADEKIYLIPTDAIHSISSITVGKKYSQYEVFVKPFSALVED